VAKGAYSETVVHQWHLSRLRGGLSWQAHYIAVCFDALLLRFEQTSGIAT
jgi:hypothetical protein